MQSMASRVNWFGVMGKKKMQLQISCVFILASWIVLSLFFLNQKFEAYSYLLLLYRLVLCQTWLGFTVQTGFVSDLVGVYCTDWFCVRPGWKPQRLVFAHCGSYDFVFVNHIILYKIYVPILALL